MAIRLSGLNSGMDTEALVGALMSAQSLKKTKVENAKTKLEWKQTKWQDINTKLTKLYNEQVTKMRLQGSYMTKKATVSDETKASITASSKAVNGNYTLEVLDIAKAQYVTGGEISATSTSTKLIDIDANLLNKELEITVGGKTSWFTVTEDTKISDFTDALKSAGLNASYDTNQKRFFISSKDSGAANAFSITTSAVSTAELDARNALKEVAGYESMNAANKKIVDDAITTLRTSGTDSEAYTTALDAIAKASYDTKSTAAKNGATAYVQAKLYAANYDSYKEQATESLKTNYYNEDGTVKDELVTKYKEEFGKLTDTEKTDLGVQDMTEDEYVEWKAAKELEKAATTKAETDTLSYVKDQTANNQEVIDEINLAAVEGKTKDDILAGIEDGLTEEQKASGAALAIKKYYGSSDKVEGYTGTSTFNDLEGIKSQITASVEAYASLDEAARNEAGTGSALNSLGLGDITADSSGTLASGAVVVKATDSRILLNDAELKSGSATVSVNGLDISLTGLTKGEEITFSVSTDVDAVYDSIKNFVKEYNSIMKEMNTAYTAKSARGYDPLSKEEKEAMTDDDVKLWEDKIKDSLLRNDTNLNGIMRSMRSAMQSTVEYDGKTYSLASFGIMTSKDYMEGGLYHIYGDTDDSVYASKDDKLKKALQEDPDAVINVLTGVFEKLRSNMSDKMAASRVSSALTFYNDISIKNDLKEYEDDIDDWEDKLADLEDSYYKKFTAMETAMAKLQSQQSSLAGLFGGY